MLNQIKKFAADEQGVAAIEYGMIVALISVAITGGLRGVGESIAVTFETVDAALNHA